MRENLDFEDYRLDGDQGLLTISSPDGAHYITCDDVISIVAGGVELFMIGE